MKAETLRNAVHAHGWLGLLISVPLFIVFWAGAISLFYPELKQWSMLPHSPVQQINVETHQSMIDLNFLVEQTIADYHIDKGERISLNFPTEHEPYIRMNFDRLTRDKETAEQKKEYTRLVINPTNGKTVYEGNPFQLADFLYQLHYSLKLPQGLYIVGVVTLFFLILVFTGLLIQLKNLFKHFFMYRHESSIRNKMHDMHNVIGVISLPYAFMYALTGLMFNLSLVLQIPSALLLYQGDVGALTKDAGLLSYSQEQSGKPLEMTNITTLVNSLQKENNMTVSAVNLFNYGDETAVYRIIGRHSDKFAGRYDVQYEVKSGEFPADINTQPDNIFAEGTSVLFSMHFADFGGVAVRFVFFLLALAICGMIIAGNVLWIAKRQKRNLHSRTLAIMRGLTLGGCVGIVPATSIAIVLERILPIGFENRVDTVQLTFALVLLASVVLGFICRNHRKFVGYGFSVGGVALLLAVIGDGVLFGKELFALKSEHFVAPLGISLSLLVSGIIICLISYFLLIKQRSELHM